MPAAQVHAHAAEGVAGAGGPVPYRAELERSMGSSAAPMLDRISVHQDAQAQAASAAIGAQAYASGDRIALPPSPSLHLVAHEVAHVAQQAEGVHLAGGVGQESDPHERAADAFADAVVDGRPVPFAGSGAGGVRPSVGHVQRRTAHESFGPATPKPADAGDSTPHAAGGESAATEHAFDELEPWQLVAEVGQPAWTPERAVAIDREVRARTQRLAKQSGDAVASSQRAGGHVSGVAEAIQLDELTKPLLAIHTEALTHLAMPLSGTNRAALAAYVGWFADAHARWTPAHAAFKAWLLDQHLWEDVNGSGTTGGTRESPGLGAVGAVNAALYVTTHATAISQATSRYLQAVPWTPVHARLAWRDAHGFAQEVSRELTSAWGDLSSPEMLQALADAVRPADALAIVDQMRPMVSEGAADRGNAFRGGALGSSVWQASIGVAIAQLVHSAVVESARRLGTRWVAAADAAHRGSSAVATGIGVPDLAPSSPLDAHVARALTGIDIVAYTPPTSAAPAEPAPKRHARVSVAWQGASSPSLWNWVKADPPDATAEEVADALWPRGAYRAHTLIGAAPLFGVPPELAREFEEARAHAPEAPGPLAAVSAKPAAPEGVLVAADSSAASEIALHQAPAATPDARAAKSPAVTRAMEAIGESRTDLVFLATIFASWGRADATGVALKFIEGKSVELATADDATATTWLRVLEAQRGHLATLSRLVHEVSGAAAKLGMSDPRDPAAAPLREVIDVLAQAAGSSHLNETCAAQIAKAGRLLDNLALEALRGTMRSMAATVDQSRSAAHEDRESHGSATALDRVNVDAERLQAEMVAGRAVDADELADVTLRAEEIALDAKLHGLLVELLDLEHAMEVDGFFEWAAAEMSASFLPTARAIPGLRGKLMDAQEHLRPDGAASPTPGAAQATATRSHRQRALAQAKAEYAAVQSKHDLGEFLREGASLVKWQQVRTACVKVAAMIGVGVVAGAAATTAGKAVAGMLGAGEGGAAVAELSMAGRLAKAGAEVVADATVNTAGMTVSTAIDRDHAVRSTTGPEMPLEQDSLDETALNNLLFSAASKGIIEPLARDMASLEQAEVTSLTRWQKAGAMVRATSGELAAVTGHAILGAAVGSVTHLFGARVLTAPPATLQEWLLQSASIAIGRAIGRRAAARAERLAKANLPKELIAQSRAIETAARTLEHGKGPASEAATLELMAREHAALEAEAQTLEEVRRDPVKLAATGLQWEEAAALSTQANAGLANDHSVAVAAIQFRLAGLEEAVPGALWRGTREEVTHALAKAREAKVDIKATHDPDGHRWSVEIDGQKVSLLERLGDTAAAPLPGSVGHAQTASREQGPSSSRSGDSPSPSNVAMEDYAAIANLPPLEKIEGVTGVRKGPEYEQAMADLRSFYAEMETEAAHISANSGRAVDGPYRWGYAHDAQTFSHGLSNVVFKVHLNPAAGVGPAELATLRARVHQGVDQYYNSGKAVRGPDGVERRLHVEVVFVDNLGDAHLSVQVFAGNGRARVNRWYVDGHPATAAHEIAHGAFGLKDEYVDSWGNPPGRGAPGGPNVHDDDSLMGDYWADQLLTSVRPGTELKDRHLDAIGAQMPLPPSRVTPTSVAPAPESTPGAAPAAPDSTFDPLHQAAVHTLAKIPIQSETSPDGATAYFVASEDAAQIRALAPLLGPHVHVRELPRGILVRSPAGEVFLQVGIASSPDSGRAATLAADRDANGLPIGNAVTIEFHGFRGVRDVRGVRVDALPPEHKRVIQRITDDQPLLKYGHVGVSFDGGETIWGFTPDRHSHPEMSDDEFLNLVRSNIPVPGRVADDTEVFRLAEKYSRDLGWDTHVITSVQSIDGEKKAAVMEQVGAMAANRGKGEGTGHGKQYQFPYPKPQGDSHYAGPDCRNCSTFMDFLGLPLPDPSGILAAYIPALKEWAARSPLDQRTSKEQK